MEDWQALLLRGIESRDLDYKGHVKWDSKADKKACCEIVKDILAFANTTGGWIIFGVADHDGSFERCGLSDDELKSFETTKINNFVQNYADPPINTTFRKVALEEKNFVILIVPRFESVPHVCQKDFPEVLREGELYIRTADNASAPIKSSADMHALIEAATRNRRDSLIESFRSILIHGTQQAKPADEEQYAVQIEEAAKRCEVNDPFRELGYGSLEVIAYPLRFQNDLFDFKALDDMAESGSIDYTGWPFMYYSRYNSSYRKNLNDGLESLIADTTTGTTLWPEMQYWQLRRSGLFYRREIFREDVLKKLEEDQRILWWEYFCQNTGKLTDCIARLYDTRLEESTDIVVRYRLTQTKDRVLVSGANRRLFQTYQCHEAEVSARMIHSVIEWKAGRIDFAIEICAHVFRTFNWNSPNLIEARKIIEEMYQTIRPY